MVLQLAWRGIEYLEHLESDGAASRSLLRLQSTERDHQLTRRSLPQKPEEDELTHHIIELASEYSRLKSLISTGSEKAGCHPGRIRTTLFRVGLPYGLDGWWRVMIWTR